MIERRACRARGPQRGVGKAATAKRSANSPGGLSCSAEEALHPARGVQHG